MEQGLIDYSSTRSRQRFFTCQRGGSRVWSGASWSLWRWGIDDDAADNGNWYVGPHSLISRSQFYQTDCRSCYLGEVQSKRTWLNFRISISFGQVCKKCLNLCKTNYMNGQGQNQMIIDIWLQDVGHCQYQYHRSQIDALCLAARNDDVVCLSVISLSSDSFYQPPMHPFSSWMIRGRSNILHLPQNPLHIVLCHPAYRLYGEQRTCISVVSTCIQHAPDLNLWQLQLPLFVEFADPILNPTGRSGWVQVH